MGSDDDERSGDPPGGGPGAPGIPDGKPERDGAYVTEFKAVRLVCLFCREIRVIHVPVDCDTPKEVLWECLTCQERWASRK